MDRAENYVDAWKNLGESHIQLWCDAVHAGWWKELEAWITEQARQLIERNQTLYVGLPTAAEIAKLKRDPVPGPVGDDGARPGVDFGLGYDDPF